MAEVVVAGASGPIGGALRRALAAEGFGVRRLVRRPASAPGEISWDPSRDRLDPAALAGAAAVINLSGRSIGATRWTPEARREIMDSRVRATRLLVDTMRRAGPRPQALISASAIGYYGDRGDAPLTEEAAPGAGFLADVVVAWEREAQVAERYGVRVVRSRFGLVLAPRGGFLDPMLPVFRLGLGGPFGHGRQWWSWVHIDDVTGGVLHVLRRPDLAGAVNVTSPAPVRNREFARALGRTLRRPAFLPAPRLALEVVLGRQRADELLLFSQRVVPVRLTSSGYAFRWTSVDEALADVVRRRAAGEE